MGQQSNKIQKRRRREAYIDRKNAASKSSVKPKAKARAKKTPAPPAAAPAA